MRLTQKKIDEVVLRILGEDGLKLADLLKDAENVSEFDIAKKLKKDIKVVRKMLYLLYNHNLVSFTRKKDKQKGWYIYYWTLVTESLRFAYLKRRRELLVQLTEELNQEINKVFFQCPEKCVRLDFDDALEFEFRCPECGKLLEQDDSSIRIEELKSTIVEIEEELRLAAEEKRKKRAAKKKAIKKQEEKERRREEKRLLKEEKDKILAKKRKELEKKRAAQKRKREREALRKKKAALKKKKLAKKKQTSVKKSSKAKKVARKKRAAKKKILKKKKTVSRKKATKKKVTKKSKVKKRK